MKLLIVDDERYIRNSLRNGFDWEKLGFKEVFEAARVSEALDIIKNNMIDVIVTDIRMPKISGIDLIKEMSQLSPRTKIIILSGYDEFEYAQIAVKYGVIDYLLKPAPLKDIIVAVKKAIESILPKETEKYKSVLRKDFLLKLIFGHIKSNKELIETIDEYGLEPLEMPFIPILFWSDNLMADSNCFKDLEGFFKVCFDGTETLDFFDDNRGHFVAFISGKYLKQDLVVICDSLSEYIAKHLNLKNFKIILGQMCNNVTNISNIYEEAIMVLDRYNLVSDEHVIFVDDLNNAKAYNIVYMAKQYVDEHISENITIEAITDVIHITPNYFSYIFKKNTGENFIGYVNSQKINKAKKLLLIMDVPIGEVAEKCGFLDTKYFNRVFKKHTNMTPSEYRKFKLQTELGK